MKELKDYTDDELRGELKRRAEERRRNTPREIVYKEFEATVKSVANTSTKYNGHISRKPFPLWLFRVGDCSSDIASQYEYREYKLKHNTFRKKDAPNVGDRVRLRYRRTKSHESFDLYKAKIIEIISRA